MFLSKQNIYIWCGFCNTPNRLASSGTLSREEMTAFGFPFTKGFSALSVAVFEETVSSYMEVGALGRWMLVGCV